MNEAQRHFSVADLGTGKDTVHFGTLTRLSEFDWVNLDEIRRWPGGEADLRTMTAVILAELAAGGMRFEGGWDFVHSIWEAAGCRGHKGVQFWETDRMGNQVVGELNTRIVRLKQKFGGRFVAIGLNCLREMLDIREKMDVGVRSPLEPWSEEGPIRVEPSMAIEEREHNWDY